MASDTSPDTMSGMDKISDLPDDMLYHILSFLPTKVAVLTTVLSKRWMGLWRSVLTLDFEEDCEPDYKQRIQFIMMVYAVILQRDVEPVHKFSLKFSLCATYLYEHVNTWVKAVLKRGARDLDLYLPNNMRLPSAIIGSKRLVVLKLDCISINTIVTNDFPSLKVLHLYEVVFRDEQCLKHFLFGCPILEELVVDDLTLTPLLDDRMILGSQLQSLNNLVGAYIRFSRPFILLEWICKVQSLHLYEECTPNFEFECTFPNLTFLVLLIDHYSWSWLLNVVLRNCPNLQYFEFENMVNSINSPAGCDKCDKWSLTKFVPECISIHLTKCTLRNYQGLKCELHFLKYVMQHAKVLRIMRICSGIFLDPEEKLKTRRKMSTFPKKSAECEIHLNIK